MKLLLLPALLTAFLALACPCIGNTHPPFEKCCSSRVQTFGPYVAYITSPHYEPDAAVIMASDVYGFTNPLLRKFADKIASKGYFVVVPDFFNGDPFKDNVTVLSTWLEKHEPSVAEKGALKVIKILKKKGFSSVGAVGFCWGGKVGVDLAKGNTLKVVAVAHPALMTVDDFKEVRTPIAVLAGALDAITPPSLIRKIIAVLKMKPKLKSFVRIYPGAPHGWTIQYDPNDPKAVARAEKAQRVIIAWLGKFLHK